ncbi:MAG: FtsX-like permease family protein [Saprospiraceae bacterium]|nr:FtsX-like permease family protein [Saprospiraceae bacterium]
MLEKFNTNFILAMEAIGQNKLRSLLTALGIIFGVFAVIAMMAIGNGAEKSILDQLEIIGTNNIIIEAIPPTDQGTEEEGEESASNEEKKKFTPGLTKRDAESIAKLLSNEESIAIEIGKDSKIIYGKNTLNTKIIGTNNDFFKINSLDLYEGNFFNSLQEEKGINVCILGSNISKKLFLGKSPLGQYVKVDHVIYKVIGTLKSRVISAEAYKNLGISNRGNQVFIPYKTFKLRIEDKSSINERDILSGRQRRNIENYHQLDKIVVKVNEASEVQASGAVIDKLLTRTHNQQSDFKIEIPELLIKQQQDTQETLNFVFAIIAGISLLVGGIGIMNIMLASVMERISEIGLRRAIGATEGDIIFQFLLEAVAISLIGGLLGIILGVVGAHFIGRYADIPTVISGWSIILSFGIAASIGIIFGLAPAKKAAEQDPITALRTD